MRHQEGPQGDCIAICFSEATVQAPSGLRLHSPQPLPPCSPVFSIIPLYPCAPGIECACSDIAEIMPALEF